VYGQRYAPSAESLGPPGGRVGHSDSSTPTFVDYGGPAGAREAYPAWSSERQIPLSKEEIEDIFLDLTQKFGFQRDSMRNMVSPSIPYIVFSESRRGTIHYTTATLTRELALDCLGWRIYTRVKIFFPLPRSTY